MVLEVGAAAISIAEEECVWEETGAGGGEVLLPAAACFWVGKLLRLALLLLPPTPALAVRCNLVSPTPAAADVGVAQPATATNAAGATVADTFSVSREAAAAAGETTGGATGTVGGGGGCGCGGGADASAGRPGLMFRLGVARVAWLLCASGSASIAKRCMRRVCFCRRFIEVLICRSPSEHIALTWKSKEGDLIKIVFLDSGAQQPFLSRATSQ